jgi:hypothetical protein
VLLYNEKEPPTPEKLNGCTWLSFNGGGDGDSVGIVSGLDDVEVGAYMISRLEWYEGDHGGQLRLVLSTPRE